MSSFDDAFTFRLANRMAKKYGKKFCCKFCKAFKQADHTSTTYCKEGMKTSGDDFVCTVWEFDEEKWNKAEEERLEVKAW